MNIYTIVELYDSHPGFGGAAIPLPDRVRLTAQSLEGKKMTVHSAYVILHDTKGATDGEMEIVWEHNFIGLWIPAKRGSPSHLFRVIKFREVQS